MAVKVIGFGTSVLDEAVKEWLVKNGIDPYSVRSYTIKRGVDDSSITLTMNFDDIEGK